MVSIANLEKMYDLLNLISKSSDVTQADIISYDELCALGVTPDGLVDVLISEKHRLENSIKNTYYNKWFSSSAYGGMRRPTKLEEDAYAPLANSLKSIFAMLEGLKSKEVLGATKNTKQRLLELHEAFKERTRAEVAKQSAAAEIKKIAEAAELAHKKALELARSAEEAKRMIVIMKIRRQLEEDFLGADLYFSKLQDPIIPQSIYDQEKNSFVQRWIESYTRRNSDTVRHLPDNEQISAIAAVNGHIQVVARAGSGKTTTLVHRAVFLLKHCGVAPSEMLLLAFNRKAALEVRRRMLGLINEVAGEAVSEDITRRVRQAKQSRRIDMVEIESNAVDTIAKEYDVTLPFVMTFHALAYSIVHPEESLLFNGSNGESQGLSRVFQQVIDDHLQVPTFRGQIRNLMLEHFREAWDLIVEGKYDQSKDELLRFRRSLPRESIGGDYVKSFGEKVIADFLFEHDIAFKYERNHWWSGINYRPDFTIFKTQKSGVIIEYFGLNGDADYDRMSDAKRTYWDSKKDWELLEFTPTDIVGDGVGPFLNCLKSRLEHHGIPCIQLSEDEIWHRIRERAIDRFTKATVGFIGRCRKQSLSPADLNKMIGSYSPLSHVEEMFLGLAHQLYVAYLDRLAATGDEDFDGLMQRAANAISSGKTEFLRKSGNGNLNVLRYICIDEFQDFSDLFYRLLTAIRNNNHKVELFCVGDDWQAINGFAGSDLRFFENFDKYIGKSRRLYISSNYRSANSIVKIGNTLMDGLGKPAVGFKKVEGKVLISDLNKFEPTLIEMQRHPGDSITPAITRLANKALAEGMDVVMLCRRNGLPWFVNFQDEINRDGMGLPRFLDFVRSFFPDGLKERISISTAHKYKGLEKPMVIVLDAVARSYPLIHPDWAFSRILGDSPEKIIKEERRLLYVAITRAADTLVIFTDGLNKSPFLEELEKKQRLSTIDWSNYPPIICKSARLVVKIGNQERKGGAPTFAIKDSLKASGYTFQRNSTGWPGWEKSFPVEGFDLNTIKSEVWSGDADGLDVRVFDDTTRLVAQFFVNNGCWVVISDVLDK